MKINGMVNYTGNADEVVSRLDKAGLDKAVICAGPEGILINNEKVNNSNEAVCDALEKYPQRFMGVCYINPLSLDALDKVKFYKSKGFIGVKLFPADGYFPDDTRLYPLLGLCEKLKMSVIFHVGLSDYSYESSANNRKAPNSSFAQPMKLDGVARLFPDINFIITNMGYPLLIEGFSVFHNSKNIYMHFGGSSLNFTSIPVLYTNIGGQGFIPLDFNRVIFGTGYADDMLASCILAKDYARKMGASVEQAENITCDNVKNAYFL